MLMLICLPVSQEGYLMGCCICARQYFSGLFFLTLLLARCAMALLFAEVTLNLVG